MKILIDTNIYLDFYRSNKEALKLFDELVNHYDSIIITDQIIQEFERSREKVIRGVKHSFEVESKIEDFSSSFIQSIPEFQELVKLRDSYKSRRQSIAAIMTELITNPSRDPIASFFKEFIDEAVKKEQILYTTDEIIKKAEKRKLVGNPPRSDKFSIGDEINWEIILANIKEDIFIVGRDETYNNNFTFLQKDFHKHTGHFIIGITDKITIALKQIGVETSDALAKEEGKQIDEIKYFNRYWRQNAQTN